MSKPYGPYKPYEDIIDFLQTTPETLHEEFENASLTQEECADRVLEMLGIPRQAVEELATKLEDSHPFPDVVGQLLKSHLARMRLVDGVPAQTEEEDRLRTILIEGIVGREP